MSPTYPAPAFQLYVKDWTSFEDILDMNNEEFGFFVRCLMHSWTNFGLPASLETIARQLHQSIRKVRRLWVRVGKCFELINGRWLNPLQEQQRSELEEYKNERSESGRKGAQKRWSKPEQQPLDFDSSAIAQPLPSHWPATAPAAASPSSEPFSKREGVPAAAPASPTPPNPPEAAEAAVPPDFERTPEAGPIPESEPASNLPVRPFTDRDHEDIANRCAELGLHSPDRKTAALIVSRFPSIPISRYPKFPMQNSPGLWLHKTSLDVQLEMARQSKPEPRELTKFERQREEDLAWAREIDRRRATQS